MCLIKGAFVGEENFDVNFDTMNQINIHNETKNLKLRVRPPLKLGQNLLIWCYSRSFENRTTTFPVHF